MYDAKWDLRGLQAMIDTLQTVTVDTRGKSGRSALRSAAKIVVGAAKQNASKIDDPKTAESIEKNIVQSFSTKFARTTGDLKVRVGVLGGARNLESHGEFTTGRSAKENPGGDTFHWRFLEFGTSKIAPRPFMTPALAEHTDDVEAEFTRVLVKNIDRILRKRNRRA